MAVYEGVGRLWLSLDFTDREQEKIEFSDTPPELVLAIHIDENNLVSVGAHLKGLPDFSIQHSISRGKADEKLYLRLEKGIKEANDRKNYWLNLDYQERAKLIVEDIHQVLDKQTEKVNKAVAERADAKLELAGEFQEREEPIFAHIWYVESLYEFCRYNRYFPLDPAQLKRLGELGERLEALKKSNREAKQDADTIDDLLDELKDDFRESFPKQEHYYKSLQFNEKAESLGMHKELEEIKNISMKKDSMTPEDEKRLHELSRKIRDNDNNRKSTIDTEFTLAQ